LTYLSKDAKQVLARIGFVQPNILKKMEVENTEVVYAEISLEKVFSNYLNKTVQYNEVSKFPVVERDLSLLLDTSIQYASIKQCIQKAANHYLKKVELFDVYQGKNIPENKKSYAVRLYLQDTSKTLTDKEIDTIMNKIINVLKNQLKAELR